MNRSLVVCYKIEEAGAYKLVRSRFDQQSTKILRGRISLKLDKKKPMNRVNGIFILSILMHHQTYQARYIPFLLLFLFDRYFPFILIGNLTGG